MSTTAQNDSTVVITGAGIVCSLGSSASEVWDALLSGRHGIGPINGFDAAGFDCKTAAQAQRLNPADLGISSRDSRIMGTHTYLLMKSARDAFYQSGFDKAPIPPEELGFYAGMGMVDYEVGDLLPGVLKSLNSAGALDYDAFYSEGYKEIYPLWPLSMLNNIGFCQVAINLGLKGENTVFSPHGDSGALAIAEGVKTILGGRSRAVLAGGVSETVTPLSLARAQLSGVLTTGDGDGTTLCRPFDVNRRGTVLGEGCGVVALELLSSAKKRNTPFYASVTGFGIACERDGTSPGPTSRAFALSMEMALDSAGLSASDIDVIIAHGDGTICSDRNELEAVHQVLSGPAEKVHVLSSKGALGHLMAGAPAVDTVIALSMIRTGIIPATCNSPSPEGAMRFTLVNKEPVRKNVEKVLINCQSYEGQAASLIVEAVTA